jgi:serine/threonine protein kinase/tetratricopeptide (TPR) repeat protein
MTPERWQQVKAVLATALEVPAAERSNYLDQNCAGDQSLRETVQQLLGNEESSQDFLTPEALATTTAAVLSDEGNFWLGRRVGPYKITQQIGAGGMGEVYRAVRADSQYEKEVALKLVRAGQYAGFVIDRFRNERQILATLDHENIARLVDGGTTEDGTPYFVMELIEGRPLAEYCEQHHLSITQSLRLFLKVCAAVQYAHQRLIIHRDIKPGNILVTSEGTPKLLDFGIAKIVDAGPDDPRADATITAFRILTPHYASPEQIIGAPMTTSSDVYSLGVVLYELLSGQSPYGDRKTSPAQVAQAVCHDEPERPSVAVLRSKPADAIGLSSEKAFKQLRGDLDNIVLMALRKEPARRYQSVEQFAEDIRRHLADVPVMARQDTAWYRSSKFVIRHRVGVISSAVATVALFAGLVYALHEGRAAKEQAQIASVQRARAERRFNDVRRLANSLMFEIHDSIKDLPGATPARKLLVNRALEYLDSLSREAEGDLSLQRELASAYDRVGDVLGYNGGANLGDYAGAMRSYTKALAIRETASAAHPDDLQVTGDLLNDYFRLGFSMQDAGNDAGAFGFLQKGLPVAQRLASEHPDVPKYKDWLAGFYWSMGNVLSRMGDYPRALASYRQGTSIREPIAQDPAATFFRTHLAGDYYGVGQMLMRTGNLGQAVESSRTGVRILEELSQADSSNATLREFLGESYGGLMQILEQQGDLDEAVNDGRKALAIYSSLVSLDPSNRLAGDNLGFAEANLGEALVAKGNPEEAMKYILKATATFEGIDHKSRYVVAGQAQSYLSRGTAVMSLANRTPSTSKKLDQLREARSWYQRSLATWQQEPDHDSKDPFGSEQGKRIIANLAKCDAAIAGLNHSDH